MTDRELQEHVQQALDWEPGVGATRIGESVDNADVPSDEAYREARFAAVKRWFEDDWMRIEPKLRTSIVEGVSVFLSLFDDNPQVKYAFCPPKETYERSKPTRAGTGRLSRRWLI